MILEQELRQMYCDDNMTQSEIAEVFGVSQICISRQMKICDIQTRTHSEAKLGRLRPNNPLKPQKKYLEEMYHDKKMSSVKIANEIGVSHRSILNWMQLYGIESRTVSESMIINSLKPLKKDLEEMYLGRMMSIYKIADEIGVSYSIISIWLQSYGIETRTGSDYTGENSPGWKGGISFEPYCKKFNNKFKEAVRIRDDYTCQLCGHEQKSGGQKLDVHHIHYEKSDCWPDVVALCRSCNVKVNSNRDYWEQYFENQLSERNMICWSLSQEI